MEQNVNNSVIEEVSSDVVCDENQSLDKKDLLKAGGVVAGTIFAWEVGKKLVKKGCEKLAPTKFGKVVSKANPKTIINNAKAKKAAKIAEKEAQASE